MHSLGECAVDNKDRSSILRNFNLKSQENDINIGTPENIKSCKILFFDFSTIETVANQVFYVVLSFFYFMNFSINLPKLFHFFHL